MRPGWSGPLRRRRPGVCDRRRSRPPSPHPRRGSRPSARHARAHAGRAVSSPRGRRQRRTRAPVRGSAALERARSPLCTTRFALRRPGPPPTPSTVGDLHHRPQVVAVAAGDAAPVSVATAMSERGHRAVDTAAWCPRASTGTCPSTHPRHTPQGPTMAWGHPGETRHTGGATLVREGDREPRSACAAHRASPRAVRSGRHVARHPWSHPDPVRSGVWGGR